jgi:hypothetical protein
MCSRGIGELVYYSALNSFAIRAYASPRRAITSRFPAHYVRESLNARMRSIEVDLPIFLHRVRPPVHRREHA